MTVPTTEAPIPTSETCWTAQDFVEAGHAFTEQEHAVDHLLTTWAKREAAPMLLGADTDADQDLPPRVRSQMVENRRLRLREEYLVAADAALQKSRMVVAMIEAQAPHHTVDTYLRRYSLRAGGLTPRVQAAADVELPELAREAARSQSLELAGAVAAELARRDGLKPDLRKATGAELERVAIPERDTIRGHARAVRDRALQMQLKLIERLMEPRAVGPWKLGTVRKLAKDVW